MQTVEWNLSTDYLNHFLKIGWERTGIAGNGDGPSVTQFGNHHDNFTPVLNPNATTDRAMEKNISIAPNPIKSQVGNGFEHSTSHSRQSRKSQRMVLGMAVALPVTTNRHDIQEARMTDRILAFIWKACTERHTRTRAKTKKGTFRFRKRLPVADSQTEESRESARRAATRNTVISTRR